MKKFKLYQKVYVIYSNPTFYYKSWKIEEGKFLGEIADEHFWEKHYYIEHNDDQVEYLKLNNVFATENEAVKELIKKLQNKLKGDYGQ